MKLSAQEISHWAAYLDRGLLESRELDRITSTLPGLTSEDAYRVQKEGIHLREGRGERVIGFKMGLTSQAKREQMGLHEPVYGVLTDRMRVEAGRIRLSAGIHPKIEPEIAFHIASDLSGDVTESEVLQACSGVSAALEILDSRYKGFKYFSLPDVIADNSSSAWFAVGDVCKDFLSLDLAGLTMSLSVNGRQAQSAVSKEISGNPVRSVIQLCSLLASQGKSLPAGSVVLAGAATTAVALEAGMAVRLDVEGLAALEVRVE